jgi:predicted DNA-binding transcriptional regulator YafY
MDILKYGADCTVTAPPELTARVTDEIGKKVKVYGTAYEIHRDALRDIPE